MKGYLVAVTLLLPTALAVDSATPHQDNEDFSQGCLFRKVPGWTQKRVCNSEDPPNAVDLGLCSSTAFPDEYQEVRIYGANWQSILTTSWLIQIILSELLGVPATIESGSATADLNLYSPSRKIEDWGSSAPTLEAMERAHNLSDCTLANKSPSQYEACAHIVPEDWTPTAPWIQTRVLEGVLEPPVSMGASGEESWFVTKFTLEEDPTLASYMGMQGDQNRRKLAETFKRPTTWMDYCEQVSKSNCTQPDDVALRPPSDAQEEQRMFLAGIYTGYFRATEENDCDANPETCTGHIGDYPCGWPTYVAAQTYHNQIALSSSGSQPGNKGYSYEQLVDMWHAANATRNHLVMQYWTPEPLYQLFLGTEAEFTKVTLPPKTQECVNNRVDFRNTCSLKFEERVGKPEGACGDAARPLAKEVVGNFGARDKAILDAAHSPAYSALQLFHMTEYIMYDIMQKWQTHENEHDAVCSWAAENLELLQTFIPKSFPRVVQDAPHSTAWLYATTSLGCLAALATIMTALLVYLKREKPSIRNAQIGFLRLLLVGTFSVCLAAILGGLPATDSLCVVQTWFLNIGYVLELVPLIVKIAAINQLVRAAMQTAKPVVLTRCQLYGAVAAIFMMVVGVLSLWTSLDPPHQEPEYMLTDYSTGQGETIVHRTYYCDSESAAWQLSFLVFQTLLLLIASLMAYQARKFRLTALDETGTLVMMIYSHFLFVVLRFALHLSFDGTQLRHILSLIFSIDTMATLLIYFFPKLFGGDDSNSQRVAPGSNSRVSSAGAILNHDSETSMPFACSEWVQPKRTTEDEKEDKLGRSSKGETTLDSVEKVISPMRKTRLDPNLGAHVIAPMRKTRLDAKNEDGAHVSSSGGLAEDCAVGCFWSPGDIAKKEETNRLEIILGSSEEGRDLSSDTNTRKSEK